MQVEVCKCCPKVIATDLCDCGFYCARLMEEDSAFQERLNRRLPMGSPRAFHQFLAHQFNVLPGRPPPMSCPFRVEHAVIEGDTWFEPTPTR